MSSVEDHVVRSPDYGSMRFYSHKQIEEISNDIEEAVTIPVNFEIKAEHRVYDFSEVRDILGKAKRIAVQDCGCRTEHHNCDAPRDVCLSLDYAAHEQLDKKLYNAREIDLEEALGVLKRSHEAGLVHMAYTMKGEDKPGVICSCCPCCCHTLGSLVRKGVHTQMLTSKYIAVVDRQKCVQCGRCVERCVFQARWMRAGEPVFDQSRCFGCGLCVSSCPTAAITLVTRPDNHHVIPRT